MRACRQSALITRDCEKCADMRDLAFTRVALTLGFFNSAVSQLLSCFRGYQRDVRSRITLPLSLLNSSTRRKERREPANSIRPKSNKTELVSSLGQRAARGLAESLAPRHLHHALDSGLANPHTAHCISSISRSRTSLLATPSRTLRTDRSDGPSPLSAKAKRARGFLRR